MAPYVLNVCCSLQSAAPVLESGLEVNYIHNVRSCHLHVMILYVYCSLFWYHNWWTSLGQVYENYTKTVNNEKPSTNIYVLFLKNTVGKTKNVCYSKLIKNPFDWLGYLVNNFSFCLFWWKNLYQAVPDLFKPPIEFSSAISPKRNITKCTSIRLQFALMVNFATFMWTSYSLV